MKRLTLATSLSFGLGAALVASEAFAQDDCSVDADCEAGFVCGVIGSSGCAGEACAENDPDCKVEPVDCAPEEFYGCVAAPCETDADCGADMVCEVTAQWESCGGAAPACDEDGNCEPVPEPECESGSSSQCVYKWETSCEVDADCGEGFTCKQEEVGCDCASSGGGADPVPGDEGDDGGEADFAPAQDPPEGELPLPPEEEPVDCGCGEPEVYTYCAAEEIKCESNDDCPSSWTCEAIYERGCGDVGDGGDDSTDPAERPAVDGEPFQPVDGEEVSPPAEGDPLPPMDGGVDLAPVPEPQPCEPVIAAQMCVPPGDVGIGRGDDEGGVTTGSDGSVGEGDIPLEGDPNSGDDEAEEPPTEDDKADDGVGSPDDDVTDDDEDADEDDTADDDADDDDADDDADDGSEKSGVDDDTGNDSSCSVAQTGSGSGNGAWLSLLLGLPLILRRRRNK